MYDIQDFNLTATKYEEFTFRREASFPSLKGRELRKMCFIVINKKLNILSSNQQFSTILERAYIFLFGFLFLDAFYRTTMFPQTFVVNRRIPTLTLLALIFLKLLLYGWEKPLQSVLIGVLTLSFLGIYKITRDINLAIMAYLVICAYGVSFRKIFTVYTTIRILMLLFYIVTSQIGLMKDLVYEDWWGIRPQRHSFSIIYPTDFVAHIAYLVLYYGWLRGKKLTCVELGGISFLHLVGISFLRCKD